MTTRLYGQPELHHRQRTYVIVGNGRGGTSMVSGVVSALGLSLAPWFKGANYEDSEIVRAAQGRDDQGQKLPTTREEDIDAVKRLIAARNASNDVWGWKDPSADLYIRDVVSELRNPHFIFVWRDVAAVATAQIALQPEMDPLDAMTGSLGRLNRYWEILSHLRLPTLMVSYERGRMKPLALANELADFVGADLDDGKARLIEQFVSPTGGYRWLTSDQPSRSSA